MGAKGKRDLRLFRKGARTKKTMLAPIIMLFCFIFCDGSPKLSDLGVVGVYES